MTERTYGQHKVPLLRILEVSEAGAMITGSAAIDMVAHIRELQAEVAHLKVDRRALAFRVADACENYIAERGELFTDALQAIIEQELAK